MRCLRAVTHPRARRRTESARAWRCNSGDLELEPPHPLRERAALAVRVVLKAKILVDLQQALLMHGSLRPANCLRVRRSAANSRAAAVSTRRLVCAAGSLSYSAQRSGRAAMASGKNTLASISVARACPTSASGLIACGQRSACNGDPSTRRASPSETASTSLAKSPPPPVDQRAHLRPLPGQLRPSRQGGAADGSPDADPPSFHAFGGQDQAFHGAALRPPVFPAAAQVGARFAGIRTHAGVRRLQKTRHARAAAPSPPSPAARSTLSGSRWASSAKGSLFSL